MIEDFELIIFDWDGTLVNSIDWIVECIIDVSKQQDYPTPTEQACKDIIGLSLSEAMKQLFPQISKQQEKQMVEGYRAKYLAKPITVEDMFIDTVDVLTILKNTGKCLAVATGKGRGGLDRAINGTGIGHYFDELRCADEMQSKPSPHMLFDIMKVTDIGPEKTIMIGDSTIDMTMANNAGVACIGVTTGAHSREQLNIHRPLGCVDQLIEIL